MQTEVIENQENIEKYTLSEEKQKDLVAGLSLSVDESDTDFDDFTRKLFEARKATEFGHGWITAIIPPWAEIEDKETPDDKISVQYMLLDGTYFWETYKYSKEHLAEDNKFREIINYTGYNVGQSEQALGEPVPITYFGARDRWTVVVDERMDDSTLDATLSIEADSDTTETQKTGLIYNNFVVGFPFLLMAAFGLTLGFTLYVIPLILCSVIADRAFKIINTQ